MTSHTSAISLPDRLRNNENIETNESSSLDDTFYFSVTSAPTTTTSPTFVRKSTEAIATERTTNDATKLPILIPKSIETGYISSRQNENDTSATPNSMVVFARSSSSSSFHRYTYLEESDDDTRDSQLTATQNDYTSFADISAIEQEETLEYAVVEFDGTLKAPRSNVDDLKRKAEDLDVMFTCSGSQNSDEKDEESSDYSDLGQSWEARPANPPHQLNCRAKSSKSSVASREAHSLVDNADNKDGSQHWSEQFLFDDTPSACISVFEGMLKYLDLSGPTIIQHEPSRLKYGRQKSSHHPFMSNIGVDEDSVDSEELYLRENLCRHIHADDSTQLYVLSKPSESDISTKDGDPCIFSCLGLPDDDDESTEKSNYRKYHKLSHADKYNDANDLHNGLDTIAEMEEPEDKEVVATRQGRLGSEDSPLFDGLDSVHNWDQEEFKKDCVCRDLDDTLETEAESLSSMNYSTFSC